MSAQSKYRLFFTIEEARKLQYWKYHSNKNNPSKPSWGTGLFRYISEIECAQILRDAVAIKQRTHSEMLATDFYIHTLEKANKIQEDLHRIDYTIKYIERFMRGKQYGDNCHLIIVPEHSHHSLKISDDPNVIRVIFKNSLEELIKQKKALEKAFYDL